MRWPGRWPRSVRGSRAARRTAARHRRSGRDTTPMSTGTRHIARKRFAQHFLADASVVDAIVRAIAPGAGPVARRDRPRPGRMTDALVTRSGRLTVIELDRDLAARLRRRPELDVVEADVLTVDFSALAAWRAAARRRQPALQTSRRRSCFTCSPTLDASSTSTSCCRRRSSIGWRPRRGAGTSGGSA